MSAAVMLIKLMKALALHMLLHYVGAAVVVVVVMDVVCDQLLLHTEVMMPMSLKDG